MFPNIRDAVIALDTETTGLRFWLDKIFGVSLSVRDEDYYWDVRKTPQVFDWLRDELQHTNTIYFYNAKFDVHMLREEGVRVPIKKATCCMVRAALIDEHLPTYNLDYVGRKYVGVGKTDDIVDRLYTIFGGHKGKDAQMKNLHRAPVELVAEYAKQDTRTTLLLGLWQEDEILRQELQKVDRLEHDLLPVLVDMEKGGVRVDIDRAERAAKEISVIVGREQKQLNEGAGFEVNPNPSGSIHKLFDPKKDDNGKWVLIDGTIADSTDAGKASIDADCLRRMKHPLAAKILNIRKLLKARDTFINGHILNHQYKGYVHCNFNQAKSDNDAGTGTGRLSVNAPALQQISARDKEIAAIVRAIFVPDVDAQWLSIDWAQVDFRVAAHYVKDENIYARYNADPTPIFIR